MIAIGNSIPIIWHKYSVPKLSYLGTKVPLSTLHAVMRITIPGNGNADPGPLRVPQLVPQRVPHRVYKPIQNTAD